MSASDAIIGWPANAYVGQKVVCIKYSDVAAKARSRGEATIIPADGDIVTIRDIRVYNGQVGFLFKEIHNPIKAYAGGVTEFLFHPSRFKPLIAKSTTAQVEALKRLTLGQPEVVNV